MNLLVIFTKAPLPGRVKTRLQPHLSSEDCGRIQNAFIQDSISKFLEGDFRLRICYEPEDSKTYFEQFGVEIVPQAGEDLGERMHRALCEGFDAGAEKVVLVGTDVPLVPVSEIHSAFLLLDEADAVFGPAEDGGYYLVGGKQDLPDRLFLDIPWSTPDTLSITLQRAKSLNMRIKQVGQYFDVDTIEGLRRLRGATGLGGATQRILEALVL